MKNAAGTAAAEAAWDLLDDHFRHHAALMSRFKNAHPLAVMRMWRRGTNEFGEPLSQFDREALVERYCELFGGWPPDHAIAPTAFEGTLQRSGRLRA